ncbi:MAG: AmmeMemoRadiSam system protein A [Rhodocyclaceae bacterium]|nr:AmmeMemoRadiSam system protein A [Rhodocyclaceae bacterium]
MAQDTERSLGDALLQRAHWAIEQALGIPGAEPPPHPAFAERGACFVTLTRAGELRGCIGSIQQRRALGEDVADNAVGAALRDTRFPPLTADEWPSVDLEVSLLSRPEFLEFSSEDDVLTALRPGVDGVIFFEGCRRSTFLPQVWAQLPAPRDFLGRLKEKAGLPAQHWSPNVMIATYQVEKFGDRVHAP